MNEEKYREASQVAFDYVVETDQHNLTDVVKKNLQNAHHSKNIASELCGLNKIISIFKMIVCVLV